MPLAASSYSLGSKPIQTLGGARTPAASAYGGVAVPQIGAGAPTRGGASQTTDPYGRLTTTQAGGMAPGMGADGNFQSGYGGFGATTIETPPPWMGGPDPTNVMGGGTAPPVARTPSGGGGSGGDGGGGGGLGLDEIMGVINKLKPDPPPQREQAPGLLAREAAPQPVASPSAKSQGFARAKDNAGRVANSALQSLRSEMVNRGIEGSGVEGQLTGNILGETARGVADASFQQERAAEDQAWQAAQLGYQGAINQRGQDYGLQGTGFSGNVSQRGQDINAQPNMLALAPTILSLLGRARY